MRMIDILKLAILNIRSNLKMALCILGGLIIILEMIMISSGYGYAVNCYIRDSVNLNASDAYCCSFFELFDDSQLEMFKKNRKVEGIQVLKTYDISEYCNSEGRVVSKDILLDDVTVEINGNTYHGENDFSYDFNLNDVATATRTDKMVKLEIGIMEPENNLVFSESELKEYRNKYHKPTPFIVGNTFTKGNQLIISDYMMDKLNVEMSLSDCVGSLINIYVETDKGEHIILDSYEICGVLSQDFFRINSRTDYPQILLSSQVNEHNKITQQRVFANTFRDILQFYNENESVDNLMINQPASQYAEIETQQILFNEVVMVVCAILIMALIVFVYIVIYFYFQKRMRYVCIQRAMGINEVKLYLLILSELLIVGIVANLIAVPIFYALVSVLNEIMQLSIGNSFVISHKVFLLAVGIAFLFEIFMLTIISFTEYIMAKKYTVIQREKFM